jgi:glycosyltransferase involved in cell wall biosynthesis
MTHSLTENKKIKKIVFITGTIDVTASDGTGGVPKLIAGLSNGLVRDFSEIIVLCCYQGEKPPQFSLNKSIRKNYIQTKYKHASHLTALEKAKFWMYVLINMRICAAEAGSSIFISCTPIISIVLLATKFMHNGKVYIWENVDFHRYGKLMTRFKKFLYRYADIYITPTLSELNRLNDYKIKCRYIPNANHSFKVDFKSREAPRKTLRLLTIGRLVKQKGFDYLMESLNKLEKIDPNWIIAIIGSGPEEETIKEMAREFGLTEKINFLPHCDDLARHYLEADIYVMTSRFEGLPLVLIEAQSFGLPCVSFDCPTGPSEVIESEVNGLLVPLGDTSIMAQQIARLGRSPDLYGRCSTNARESSFRYSPDAIMRQWLGILQ